MATCQVAGPVEWNDKVFNTVVWTAPADGAVSAKCLVETLERPLCAPTVEGVLFEPA